MTSHYALNLFPARLSWNSWVFFFFLPLPHAPLGLASQLHFLDVLYHIEHLAGGTSIAKLWLGLVCCMGTVLPCSSNLDLGACHLGLGYEGS